MLGRVPDFVIAVLLLYAIPGPAMITLVHSGVRLGFLKSLATVFSIAMGEAILVAAAVFVLVAADKAVAQAFSLIAWLGVAFLIYRASRACAAVNDVNLVKADKGKDPAADFAKSGFAVALSNPTTIVFYTALLPQFVEPQASVMEQLLLLAAIYLVLVVSLDILLVTLTSSAGEMFLRLPNGRYTRIFNAALASSVALLVAINAFSSRPLAFSTDAVAAKADREDIRYIQKADMLPDFVR